jgi:hypothetical protein
VDEALTSAFARPRRGLEKKEGSMASSGVASGLACIAGIHGYVDGELLGSWTNATATVT